MKHPKFIVNRNRRGQYYFRLEARNGEVILASEAYASASGCRRGVESVRANALNDERYFRAQASDGQYYFVLTAANGRVIGVSERYTTVRRRDEGIAAVKRVALGAPVEKA
jgi:uncharacterized protein YegP (UPF0339 family)